LEKDFQRAEVSGMKGVGVSPGIVMGQVYVDWKEQIEVEKDYVDDVDGEIERLNLAVATAEEEIKQIYGNETSVVDKDEAGPDLYREHGVMLRDPEFLGEIKDMIINQNVNAAWAVKTAAEKFAQVFENMDNDSLKARADDVKDVSARVCRFLLHIEGGDPIKDSRQGLILVCKSMGTAEVTLMQKENIVGLVCEEGTIGSHFIIMARNRHKPAVVGLSGIVDNVYHEDFLIVDGTRGMVFVNPDEKTIERYRQLQEQEKAFQEHLKAYIGKPVRSADGIPLKVYGNATSDQDTQSIVEVGGHGVGLYRTEYIYLTRDRLPTEGEQFWEYKKTIMAMKGRPVTFRTLDIGGDKVPSYLNMPEELNPALGHRAIRYSLTRVDIFRSQIKAILRASAYGEVSILLPLISAVSELRTAKNIINDVKEELRKEQTAFNSETKVGVMIETPSAAVISDLIATECDFMSIGSNDLIQYTMAVDRLAPALAYLYSPFYPSVLRLVQTVIRNGENARKPVSLCGEMAGEPLLSPILFGMGLRIFSMNPSEMLRTQWILSQLKLEEMQACAKDVLNLATERDVRRYCEDHFSKFAAGAED
jgi:phosphotransferase system enzyme I (PtsI)